MTSPLKDSLATSAHYHCNCWVLVRSDGFSFAYTDHNERIQLAGYGYVFEPSGGWQQSARQRQTTLEDENLEILGVFDSDAITDADLFAGRYNGSIVIHFFVDWRVPQYGPISISRYSMPTVSFTGEFWKAEIVGLTGELKPKIGNIHSRNCPYDFGDSGTCTVDVGALSYSTVRVATVVSRSSFRGHSVDLPSSLGDNYFDLGMLVWTSGNNTGFVTEVQEYTDATRGITLQLSTPFDIVVGDLFGISPGCDKRTVTCNAYSNIVNFGGSPFMPGNDILVQKADQRN